MKPWYKVATPRREVREGRSFNPDEFAIALEQVVAKTAPQDYSDPEQFFARTCFTRALRELAASVLRRLSGETANTAPVLSLITQFGGGKTHTLTALYHLCTSGEKAASYPGVADLLREADLSSVPRARVAVFVGNAWDPQPGRETPWIDVARQLAGEGGVALLGSAAKKTPPGTKAIGQVFQAADAPVLLLFDEVLNFIVRHRRLAESFYAFLQNLTIATTGTTHGAVLISLPQSRVEMTDWDLEWQERINKVVGRVAQNLIANDEAEISEVVRRRLFEDLGPERIRSKVAQTYGDWCFERRAQLPPEWTAVDTARGERKARERIRARFEACYPFHPATLSVFQRKWQALPQYQQTRGTLAMLAQWIAWAYREGFERAQSEPLITLGSAPLSDRGFRSVVLGQLGESRLVAAIEADIAGEQAHARALDADARGPLRDIHRRVGTAILFESSGGQTDKVAHLPELRFALGNPDLDTTSIDNAAIALEARSYFIRRVGADGFKVSHRPTMKKVVSDRRASLDEENEIKPAMRQLVEEQFRRGASVPVVPFPKDGSEVLDTPKLKLIVVDPEAEWTGSGRLRKQIAAWTRRRGRSPRLYPGSLVWCIKKPGRDLRDKVELCLAWQRVAREVAEGTLGGDFDRAERAELRAKVAAAEDAAKEEVWGGYRFAVIAGQRPADDRSDGLEVIDLGAGHSSSGESLCDRVLSALKSAALLNDSIGAGYLERNWPPALKKSGAWPLASLRQSFLDGSLTRLLDPEATLRQKIVEFVARGEFGLAFGEQPDGTYQRIWFREPVSPDEVQFEPKVFLLMRSKAAALATSVEPPPGPPPPPPPPRAPGPGGVEPPTPEARVRIRLVGSIPPELWNRFGTRLVPKLRAGSDLEIRVALAATLEGARARNLVAELRQALDELGLNELEIAEE